jgi:hypothetical protein
MSLLLRLPELERARAELLADGGALPAERRARLAAKIGNDALAARAWAEVGRADATPKEVLREALRYLVQTGDSAAIEATARAHLRRFGPIEPGLVAIVEVRLAELERLMAMRPRLGLPKPVAAPSGSGATR